MSAKITAVYGIQTTLEALRAQKSVEKIWLTGTSNPSLAQIYTEAQEQGIPVQIRSKEQLRDFFKIDLVHQGVVAFVYNSLTEYSSLDEFFHKHPLKSYTLVVLDSLTDSGNFGAIIRTCECFGVSGILSGRHRSAKVTKATYKTSSGAVYHIPLIWVRNISDSLLELKERGFWVYGLDLQGQTLIHTCRFQEHTALVLGSEGEGMHKRVRESCDELVRIRTEGQTQSLNVSVSCGIALYAIFSQRAQPKH